MADRRSMMRANIGIQIAGSIGRPIPRGYVGIRRRLGQATPRAASMLAALIAKGYTVKTAWQSGERSDRVA